MELEMDEWEAAWRRDLKQGSQKWKAERFEWLTASDVATILGQGTTTKEVLRDVKVRRKERVVSAYLQRLFDWGHLSEGKALDDLERYMGDLWAPTPVRIHRGMGIHIHTFQSWLACSLDALLQVGDQIIIVEVKSTHTPLFSPDLPRAAHVIQVQTQLEVLGSRHQAAHLYTQYGAHLAPFAYLLYWTCPGYFRLFSVLPHTDFPYGEVRRFGEEVEAGRAKLGLPARFLAGEGEKKVEE
jgi:hypothetical protein